MTKQDQIDEAKRIIGQWRSGTIGRETAATALEAIGYTSGQAYTLLK